MSSYFIDCELNYAVAAPSTFVFKIEAQTDHEQVVRWERMSTAPALSIASSPT